MEQTTAASPYPGPDEIDRRQAAHLDAVRRGDAEAAADLEGVLWRADWASGTDLDPRLVWQAHVGPVETAAWGETGDGPVLALAIALDEYPPVDAKLRRHRLEVRDVPTGRVRTVGCEVPVTLLAVAADAVEPLLISAHWDDTVRVWGLDDLALRWSADIGGSPWRMTVLGRGVDARLLMRTYWARDGLQQWELATGAPLDRAGLPVGSNLSTATRADGRQVALVTDDGVLCWDPQDGRTSRPPVPAGMSDIRGATLSLAGGRELLTVADESHVLGTVDVATGQPTAGLLDAHVGYQGESLTNTHGRIGPHHNPTVVGSAVAVPTMWNVHLWDVETLRPLGPPITGPVALAETTAVRRDGRDLLLTSSKRDGVVALWDPTVPVHREPGHTQRLAALAVTAPDGTVVSADEGGTLLARRAADGTPLAPPLRTGVQVTRSLTAWAADGRAYAATGYGIHIFPNQRLYRWDLTAGRPLGEPVDTGTAVVHWIAHLRLRGGDAVATAGVYPPADFDSRPEEDTEEDEVWENEIRFWHPDDGTLLARIVATDIESGITGFAVATLDGRPTAVVSSHAEEPIRLYNPDDPTAPPDSVPGTDGHPLLAVLDGRFVAVRSDQGHVLGARVRNWRRYPHSAPAPDATVIRTWHRDGRPAGPAIEDAAPVTAFAARTWPEAYIARTDGTVSLTDLSTGRPLARPLRLPIPATTLATTPDGALAIGFGRDVALVRPPLRRF
ncbi:WD40 repeat domain-containing protein [Kitasatospora sp. NPDC048407]|uniref:WD40 repeat domain-containing protein n=1 Tax=Kitasatospora sp. NPDC048407 TaxID=3364051 RepID=UPI00371C5AB0